MMRLWAALLVVCMVAGCADPATRAPDDGTAAHDGQRPAPSTPWSPLDCDQATDPARSGNAPLVPAFAGSAEEMARAVADAVGDPIIGVDEEDVEDLQRWETQGGHVQVSTYEDGWRTASYATFHGGYPSREVTQTALVRLGADEDTLVTDDEGPDYGTIEQSWKGQRLESTGASWSAGEGDPAEDGWWGSIDFDLLYLLPDADDVDMLPARDRQAAARAYVECTMRAEGFDPEEGYTFQGSDSWGLGVMAESLAEAFVLVYGNPSPGDEHCPEKGGLVWVDVVTGAILIGGGLPCA